MKIVDVRTHPLSAPLATPFAYSQGWVRSRNALLTEVLTDEGIVGWGEAFCHGFQPPQIAAAAVEHALKPLLIGKDPLDVEVLWDLMYNLTKDYGQKGAVIGAISSVDIALWDIIGKRHGLPVYKAMGGGWRTRVRAYATGFYRRGGSTDLRGAWTEEAREHLAAGFGAMKLKIGLGVKADLRNVEAVRKALGPDPMLMVDANHGYSLTDARQVAQGLAAYDIAWLEEPIQPEDVEGYRELKQAVAIPLAAGESEFTRIGFRNWISTRAVDIIQPDTCQAGGLTECRRISALASTWGVTYIPHVWGTAVGLAAALHMLAFLPPNPVSLYPGEPLLELDRSAHPFRNELITEPFVAQEGHMSVPAGPGLGIEVNRELLSRYRAQ
jgi:D-galactarolactone cycloisomerase